MYRITSALSHSLLLCLTLSSWSTPTFSAARTEASPTGGYYEDALRYREEGDREAAIIQLKNALKVNPEHLSSRVLLGELHLEGGRPLEAVELLEKARSTGADPNLVAVPLGTAYLALARYDDVIKALPMQRFSTPVKAQVLLLRGNAFTALSRFPEAEEAFQAAGEILHDSAAPLVGEARVANARRDREKAEALLTRALQIDPDHADSHFEKGQLRRQRRQVEAALESFNRAVASDERHLRARTARAAMLVELERLDEARADVDFVRSNNRADLEAVYLDALLAFRVGDAERAREVLSETQVLVGALSTDSAEKYPSILLLDGMVEYALGNNEAAQSRLYAYLRVVPNHSGASKVLGSVLIAKRLYSQAISVLEPLSFVSSDDSVALQLLGDAYIGAGRFEEASATYKRAMVAADDPQPAKIRLAISHWQTGNTSTALSELQGVMRKSEDSLGAAMLLARLQLQRGAFDEARELLGPLAEDSDAKAPALLLLAGAQLGIGDAEAAELTYAKVLKVEPTNLAAQINLGKLEAARGKLTAATNRFLGILKEHGDQAIVMEELARISLAQRRSEDAISWLEKARAVAPTLIEPQLRLVDVYIETGAAKKALGIISELELRQGENVPVLIALAKTHYAMNDAPLAHVVLRRAAKFAGYRTESLMATARAQVAAGDLGGAQWTLEKALNTSPESAQTRALLARVLARQGKAKAALRLAGHLAKTNPTSPVGHALLGDIHMLSRDFAAAIDAYKTAMGYGPSSVVALRLFDAYEARGEKKEALAGLSAWVEAHPDDAGARQVLGASYLAAGDIDKARQHYESLASSTAPHPDVLNNLAWIYSELGDPRARQVGEKAYTLRPTDSNVLDTFGWILVQQGEVARGLELLREAHSRASEAPIIRYHIGVALHELGRTAEAKRELRAALANDKQFSGAEDAKRLLTGMKDG